MAPHQQRVVDEKNEVNDRLGKLAEFIAASPIFGKLPYDEQGRLKIQKFIMEQYVGVLCDRIDNFPEVA